MHLVGGRGARSGQIGCAILVLAAFLFGSNGAQAQRLPDAPVAKGLPGRPQLTNKFPGNDLKGIGPVDNRTAVNQNEMPWRAVGRLQGGGGSCTGALIAPALVLTAAHCVFNHSTRKFLTPGELKFQLGYADGKFSAEAHGINVVKPDEYDGILAIGTVSKDWALIELDHAIGTPDIVLPLRQTTPVVGTPVSLGGYAKDHIETLMADTQCHVTGIMTDRGGMPLLRHDCSATHGVSGAPLLIHDPSGWVVGGIEVIGGDHGGGATLLFEVQDAVRDLKKK